MLSGSSFSILAIDDSSASLAMVYEIFKDLYRVHTATSVAKAMSFLHKKPVDLILLDVEMPEMSGFEVMKRLTADLKTRDIPVVFLTGHADDASESTAFELGAVDYIKKPLKPVIVRSRIKLHLELVQYRQNLEELVRKKTSQVFATQAVTLSLLARLTEFRDTKTGEHITRTTSYVTAILLNLPLFAPPSYQISSKFFRNIVQSSSLHDIGKVSIPDEVLLKADRLTAREFEIMKTHTTNGANLLGEAIREYCENSDTDGESFLTIAREIAESHHEKWNGSGYPHGLSGPNIPFSGRVMAVADVYDALTSERPYKKAFSHEESINIMKDGRGTHFDPILLDLFVSIQSEIKNISKA